MDCYPYVEFSYGNTPVELIRERLPEHYSMSLTDPKEQAILQRVVNKGIDSHLEAVTGKFDWNKRTTKSGAVIAIALDGSVDREGMLCLLRRLWDDGSDEAWDLRSSILTTLDIGEI